MLHGSIPDPPCATPIKVLGAESAVRDWSSDARLPAGGPGMVYNPWAFSCPCLWISCTWRKFLLWPDACTGVDQPAWVLMLSLRFQTGVGRTVLVLTCSGLLRCGISLARLDQAMIASTCFLLVLFLTQPSQSSKFPWQHLAHTAAVRSQARVLVGSDGSMPRTQLRSVTPRPHLNPSKPSNPTRGLWRPTPGFRERAIASLTLLRFYG